MPARIPKGIPRICRPSSKKAGPPGDAFGRGLELEMQITSEKLRKIVKELEQAVVEHRWWLHDWHRSLIFDLPIDQVCFSPHAHRQCRFGRWYYRQSLPFPSDLAGFVTIDPHHRRLHKSAYVLAAKIRKGRVICLHDYEDLIDKEWHFNKAVLDFKDTLLKMMFEFDPLTEIFNRQALMRILQGEYARLIRTDASCCICMVDLDRFKSVNDTHGHQAGDAVLHAIAQFLSRELRPYDAICRFGGEEFLICLPNTTLEDAGGIMDRLRRGLASQRIALGDSGSVSVTASFGVAEMSMDRPVEAAIARADEAMYAAKRAGRNRVVVYDASSGAWVPWEKDP